MQKIMFNTMAEFKREAINGRYIKGGYYFRGADYGKEMRKIFKVQSNAISLITKGGGSWFNYPKASEVKIENGTMTIFEQTKEVAKYELYKDDDEN